MKSCFSGIFLIMSGICSLVFGQKDLSDKYWQKAEQLAIEGQYPKSLMWYQKAFDAIKNTDAARAANLCNDMSSAHYAMTDYESSLHYCYKGLTYLQKISKAPDSLYFKLYTSLATMHSALHRADSSRYYFEAADGIILKNNEVEKQIPAYVLHHYLHLGRSFWLLHRYHQSISYFTKALALSEAYDLTDELPYIESSLAEACDLLGDHRTALKYRLSTIQHRFSDNSRLQGFYTGIGYTYQRLNLPDSALYWQQKSWKLHISSPQNTELYKKQHLESLFLTGTLYRKQGNLQRAEKYINAADKYRSQMLKNDILIKSLILMEKGYIAESRSQLMLAETYFLQSFEAVKISPSAPASSSIDIIYPQTGLQALYLHANVQFARYRLNRKPDQLLKSYNAFRYLINLKRALYIESAEDIDERRLLSFESYDLFKAAVPVGYAYYQVDPSETILQEVFSWFEEANATYLYEVIKDKKTRSQKLPASLLEKEQNLLQKRTTLAQLSDDSSDSIKQELNDLRVQWYKLKENIRKKYPTSYGGDNQSIKFREVQDKLDINSAFISYKWFDDQIYAFVVTQESARLVFWKVSKDSLNSYLTNLQHQLNTNPGFGNYHGTTSSIACYKLLFEPLKKWIAPRNRVVIARDWQFNFLPFELLETGAKLDDFLAKNLAISYTYSASFFWKHPFDTKEHNKDQAKRSLTIAPFVKEQKLPDSTWNPVSSLKDILEIGGENLWGNRATKQQVLKAGMNFDILHFATHAFSADDNPNDSYIQLFPGIDSRLFLNEIETLPLHATRLVVLSACSAGSGKNLQGEGNISLAHAIAQAGCPSVITTTWEANDPVINYLSIRLHKYLDEGLPLDYALQKARQDLFKDDEFKEYQHPYYWANFTLIGNYEPIYTEAKIPTLPQMLIFLTGGILLFILYKITINRKSRITG